MKVGENLNQKLYSGGELAMGQKQYHSSQLEHYLDLLINSALHLKILQ